MVVTVLLFVSTLLLFVFLAKAVVFDNRDLFDTKVFEFFGKYHSPELVHAMQFMTFFGSNTFLLPAYIIIVGLLLWKKKKRWAIDIGILALSSTGLMHALKAIFQRPRPELPLFEAMKTYSFPSGHALSALIFSTTIIYLLWNEKSIRGSIRWVGTIFLILFALAIGISRIVLRHHYATDVLGGYSLGAAWALLSLWLHDKVHATLQKKQGQAA